jgi:hypothetical protein
MNGLLDKFTIAVKRCRPLQPDGYEVILELRRTADPAKPGRKDGPGVAADPSPRTERKGGSSNVA